MYHARSSAAKRGCLTQKMYLESTTIPNAFSGLKHGIHSNTSRNLPNAVIKTLTGKIHLHFPA